MKIVNYTNDNDWMQVHIEGETVYNDHISNFTLSVMVDILKEQGISIDYKVVYTDEFDY